MSDELKFFFFGIWWNSLFATFVARDKRFMKSQFQQLVFCVCILTASWFIVRMSQPKPSGFLFNPHTCICLSEAASLNERSPLKRCSWLSLLTFLYALTMQRKACVFDGMLSQMFVCFKLAMNIDNLWLIFFFWGKMQFFLNEMLKWEYSYEIILKSPNR